MNRELLEKPFTPDQIKTRAGSFGDELDYIEGAAVVQRLNEAFAGEWSFDIVEHRIHDEEVLVLGRLTAGGQSKTQFGKSRITFTRDEHKEVSLGDDLKAAATDSIKKCATLFGVGLHLYFEAPPPPVLETTTVPAAGNGNGNGYTVSRVSAKQLSLIFAEGKRKGWTNQAIRDFAMDKFGKQPDFISGREASAYIDHLKAVVMGNANGGRQ